MRGVEGGRQQVFDHFAVLLLDERRIDPHGEHFPRPLTSTSTRPPPAAPVARFVLSSSLSACIFEPISWACFHERAEIGQVAESFEHVSSAHAATGAESF